MIDGNSKRREVVNGGYQPWWGYVADHRGGIYPFYDTRIPGSCSLELAQIIDRRNTLNLPVEVDLIGVACKAFSPHLLGDRTLVRDVRRAPWMARPGEKGDWKPVDMPSHGHARPDPDGFVLSLKEALLEEAATYVGDQKTVGILLSGGMDSRIAAGVLRELQQRDGRPTSVVALTWGDKDSRDFIYSSRIAQRFGWELLHFPITVETLRRNFETAVEFGAEVSPFHLHAKPDVAAVSGLDSIIAGSYGDSVGRAEFSGRHLRRLRPILKSGFGDYGILRRAIRPAVMECLRSAAACSPHLQGLTDSIRRHEIEQEMHCMCRMLQACMQTIATRTRVCQLFTAPSVFGLMWGLDPILRNDAWYARLLPLLPGRLVEIPLARTDRQYGMHAGAADSWSKHYYAYGHWLRTELVDLVIAEINGDPVCRLGIFSPNGVANLSQAWRRATTRTTNGVDELMLWLACLNRFLTKGSVASACRDVERNCVEDVFACVGGLEANLYVVARNRLRD